MEKNKGYSIAIVSTLMVWTVVEYVASNYYSQLDTNDFIVPAKKQVDFSESAESPGCPDVNTGMMRGRWRKRTLTAQERVNIDTFLKSVRYRVPKPMQRRDGKCGNVAYENVYYIRALCNPEGATPCCYVNRCRNKSPNDCKCPNCYDLRNEIHAEYSTWEPEDSRCQVKNFTAQQACDLLQGLKIAVIGNSFMRHLYTALLLLLNNYDSKRVFRAGKPGDISCDGMYTFSGKACQSKLIRTATLCNDMIRKRKASWPKLIWFATHKFGIMKSPKMPKQENSHVAAFNKRMSAALGKYHIPIFDTYNLTSGVMSMDGAHFGIGVNSMKVQLLLNYLLELKSKLHW
ncbi:uncharacterized protein LOC124282728 isoform X2 [Haliotis rubra]|uniref:uncharacterized protein LOC124282728 isoform X2 n=1 Tax=Haliotis rubra TaxID=36100 RepID=UPI001EE63233|nr:uncharacterized protein LOC124282728 isoform X2 [Haliotis rubra]